MDIMACKDGYVVVVPGAGGFSQPGVTKEGVVSPMALLMEDPELDQNPLFQSGQARMIRWKEVDALIQPFLDTKDASEIIEFAQALRMPFAPVPTVKDLVEDEHLKTRQFFKQIDHPEAGEQTYAGAPFRMSATPPSLTRAPTLGEHNGEFDA
jgi:formyl-CoA transferase